MTPEHEAELRERAHDNVVLKMLVDLRDNTAFHEKPMDDEDFYHIALLTMTDCANTFAKCATEYAVRPPVQMIFKGSEQSEFCRACGASIPKREGEGTCPQCDP